MQRQRPNLARPGADRHVRAGERHVGARAALLGVCALLGCSPGDAREASTADPVEPSDAPLEDIDLLRALGYANHADTLVEEDERVVPVYDAQRSAPGYNLVTTRSLTRAQLFDAGGTALHEWHDREDAYHWSNADLLPNGDLLVPGSLLPMGSGQFFLLRLAWDGTVVWRVALNAHHDVEQTPSGQVAVLTHRRRLVPEVHRRVEIKDNGIALLDADGRLIEEQSLYDLLASDARVFEFQRVAPTNKAGAGEVVDLLHANSLEFLRQPAGAAPHPFFTSDHVLVSFRHQDTVAIFDWSARRVVWAWGQGVLSGQHDATLLESGNILIFDNGLRDGRSRILEVDPRTDEIVWESPGVAGQPFFSKSKGSSQRLANGNTLVADSDAGEAFEITPDGDEVWRFKNPNSLEEGQRATIVRIKRYPAEFVEPLLGR